MRIISQLNSILIFRIFYGQIAIYDGKNLDLRFLNGICLKSLWELIQCYQLNSYKMILKKISYNHDILIG